MIRSALVMMAVVGMLGCGKPAPTHQSSVPNQSIDGTFVVPTGSTITFSAPTTPQEPREEEWAAKLRQIAASRHLKWLVFCTDSDDLAEAYIAYAEPQDVNDSAMFIEEGAKPYWSEHGRSRESAGRALVELLKGPPNIWPEHARKSSPQKMKECKPDVGGGDPGRPDKYATDCKSCGVKP